MYKGFCMQESHIQLHLTFSCIQLPTLCTCRSILKYIRFLSFFFFIVFGDTSTIVLFTIRIEIKFMYVCKAFSLNSI